MRTAGSAGAEGGAALRTKNPRLREAFDVLANRDISVLSLEIFDTLLWHRIANPVARLALLGQELRHRGVLRGDVEPQLFAQVRRAAETRARKQQADTKTASVTLRTIYEHFPRALLAHPEGWKLAVETEVSVERELLVPDLDVLALLAAAHERDVLIVAVSDTCLSEDQLRSVLDHPALGWPPIEALFLSTTYGVDKAGGLFSVVPAKLGRQPEEILHLGPERHNDVILPQRAGLRALQIGAQPQALAKIVEREQRYLAAWPGEDPDFGLTALRSKVLQGMEEHGLRETLRPYWRFGATVLGPVLTGFAEWVHMQCEQEGAGQVLCVMREGELLAKLIDLAGAYVPTPVVAERLWLSRQVCRRASIVHGSREELEGLLAGRRRLPVVAEFCEMLGVEVTASPVLSEHAQERLEDPRVRSAVFGVLAGDPQLRSGIVASAGLLRRRLVRYVVERVPSGGAPLVLVDLGWGGTIQGQLQQLLRLEGVETAVAGLYLATNPLALDRLLDGVPLEGFLGNFGEPTPTLTPILRSPEFLEQVCMPRQGSQLDLSPDLTPILGEWTEPTEQADQRDAVQQGVLAFQREWARYRRTLPDRLIPLSNGAHSVLRAILARAIVEPTFEEASALGRWVHDENFGSASSESLLTSWAAHALRYLDPATLVALPMTELYWPFGLAAVHDEHLAAAMASIATGQLEPEVMSSKVETGDFEVYFDNGFGYGEDWKVALTPTRNRYGLSLVRTTVAADVVRSVRLDPAKVPCVLRFDWVNFHCWAEGSERPLTVRLHTPEDFERLTLRNCSQLAPKVILVEGADPQLIFDPAAAVGGRVYRVDVECAYAALPTSPPGPAVTASARRKVRDRLNRGKRLVRMLEYHLGLPLGMPLRTVWRLARRLRANGAT